MNFNDLKFGYWPYKPGYNTPGDRRRFIFYAREKKLHFETASLSKKYDVVYLTTGCNIEHWLNYKKENPHIKIIFESIDSYFLEGFNLISLIRGPIKFLKKKESKFYMNYNNALINMFKAADAVVCSTPIQKDFISQFNTNVHISLDYFEDDITLKKTNYQVGEKLKLVWEGQAYTVSNLLQINNVFEKLANKIELHIITDAAIVYPYKIFNKPTSKIFSKLACPVYFHLWKVDDFSARIVEADLAIIPINKKDKLHLNKPENKLLLLWQMGLPVLTTNTPAYSKVMNRAGVDFLCNNEADWLNKIQAYIQMTIEEREANIKRADTYIKKHHTKEIILQNWDNIFRSVLPT